MVAMIVSTRTTGFRNGMGFSMFIAHAINCFDAMALITNGKES